MDHLGNDRYSYERIAKAMFENYESIYEVDIDTSEYWIEIDVAFLDIEMPATNGITLAKKLRLIRPEMVIVFVTAYDEYIVDSNNMGGDYYLVKPYNKRSVDLMMERVRLIARRLKKSIYIRTFGKFTVFKDGEPVQLTGKAKEILAVVVSRHGREVSNAEIYSTVWENRPYSNPAMGVYYNALRRLKNALRKEGISEILKSTRWGQIANTDAFDCDYYTWLESGRKADLDGEFMSEYSWSEYLKEGLISN